MSNPICITLNRIKRYNPHLHSWEKLVNANGGVKADLDVSFPLSSVLDSNSLEDTLWCFRCLPEYKEVFVKFILFCGRESKLYGSVSSYIDAVEDYLEGRTGICSLTNVTDYAVSTAYLTAFDAVVTITEDENTPAHRAADEAEEAEKQKQIDYLRKLLDGEV